MSLESDLDRGTRAERLLANPLLIESFDMVRAAIIEKWEAAPMRDRDGAHELKMMLKLLTDVRANLEQAVTDGKLAAAELKLQRRELSPAQWRAEVRK